MKFKINVLNENRKLSDDLIEVTYEDYIIAKLFLNRGFEDIDEIESMINIDKYKPMDVLDFEGICDAVKLIANTINKGKKIAVYGDYDVDGVTSTTVLMTCLKDYTDKLIYHVPDRFKEGYGMNKAVIEKLNDENVSLIITCDCGISNFEEVKLAKELGMHVIVTDHHNLPDKLPPADILLNPKFLSDNHKARNISGCTMAYYLAGEIYRHYDDFYKRDKLLDLVVLSTIADVVPLCNENRYLLKKGLEYFLNTTRIGLKALIDVAQNTSKIETEEDIAFQIAPRINAAGRMESARLPVDMLLEDNYDRAIEKANRIDYLNKERKEVQQRIFDEAKSIVDENKKNKDILILYSDYWHHGIIGIVAGKISENYNKPTILLSLKEDGKTVVGSARSIEEINIYDLIKKAEHLLLKFGGHSQAAGLSLEKKNVLEFTKYLENTASLLYKIPDVKYLNVDMKLNFDKINNSLYERIRSAGPYGEGFRAPLFASENVSILSDRVTNKNHHIMVLEDSKLNRIKAVKWFGNKESYQGKVFDFVYKITKNSFRGNDEIQLNSEILIETLGEVNNVFTGEFIDFRRFTEDECINKIKEKEEEFDVFYEGMKENLNFNYEFKNPTKKSKNILFLSQPINIDYFREYLAFINPKRVYLNFGVKINYNFKEFLINTLKFLKYIDKKFEGKIELETVSNKLGIEKNIVLTLLNYLQNMGVIEYYSGKSKVKINLVKKDKLSKKVYYEKLLREALKEKEAFSRYINNVTKEELKKRINDIKEIC
jgi:single-stranded-DNA-specific exonuclease